MKYSLLDLQTTLELIPKLSNNDLQLAQIDAERLEGKLKDLIRDLYAESERRKLKP